ncbi:MAG: hypothetical protein KGQ41_01860 [Alphaproteobacteria bacterium]|nr:hypothetical protein [Alphaproteobacteria bacterium]
MAVALSKEKLAALDGLHDDPNAIKIGISAPSNDGGTKSTIGAPVLGRSMPKANMS